MPRKPCAHCRAVGRHLQHRGERTTRGIQAHLSEAWTRHPLLTPQMPPHLNTIKLRTFGSKKSQNTVYTKKQSRQPKDAISAWISHPSS